MYPQSSFEQTKNTIDFLLIFMAEKQNRCKFHGRNSAMTSTLPVSNLFCIPVCLCRYISRDCPGPRVCARDHGYGRGHASVRLCRSHE